MAKALVFYYSKTGNTQKMAEIITEGLKEGGMEAVCLPAFKVKADDLLKYDAIIAGSPTYYGLMAAPIKELLDESVKLHGRLSGRVGGAFTSSANIGGGNETTILSILYAWLIHGMIIMGDSKGDHYGPVAITEPDKRSSTECRRYGTNIAALTLKLFGD